MVQFQRLPTTRCTSSFVEEHRHALHGKRKRKKGENRRSRGREIQGIRDSKNPSNNYPTVGPASYASIVRSTLVLHDHHLSIVMPLRRLLLHHHNVLLMMMVVMVRVHDGCLVSGGLDHRHVGMVVMCRLRSAATHCSSSPLNVCEHEHELTPYTKPERASRGAIPRARERWGCVRGGGSLSRGRNRVVEFSGFALA